jgi:hypothetical protein
MKSDLEIMDEFCDDYFVGIIDTRPGPVSQHYDREQWDRIYGLHINFCKELEGCRKIKNRDERAIKAQKLLHDLAVFRRMGFFGFTNESIKQLKIEIAKLKDDNIRLTDELVWYEKNYGIHTESKEGAKPNV